MTTERFALRLVLTCLALCCALALAGHIEVTGSLGTTDDRPLELRVNNARALRLEPHTASPNLIGGHGANQVTAGARGATVGGGGAAADANLVTDDFGTIGGGAHNQAGNDANTTLDAPYATVGGGYLNQATGAYATIPGGSSCVARGRYSFAAGRRAEAEDDGCFVWADSHDDDIDSTDDDQFIVRASGGAWFGDTDDPSLHGCISSSTGAYLSWGGTWSNSCDRARKEAFAPVDPRDVLERLDRLPITTWNYKAEGPSARHMGPVAQDFHAAFGLGADDKRIATVDTDGVALAAIQGLHELLREKDAEIAGLRARLARLEELVRRLAQQAPKRAE
jgi:hypothetical protein